MTRNGMWPKWIESRLIGLSAKFDPFSVAEFDSTLVEIPMDTTLALQPIDAKISPSNSGAMRILDLVP